MFIPLNIVIVVSLHYLGWLNVYTVIIYFSIVWVIVSICINKYIYKPLCSIIDFVTNLDPEHVTEDDIRKFRNLDLSKTYSIDDLSDNIISLLKQLKLGSDMIQHLDYESCHDELTSLCNRTKLEKNVEHYVKDSWAIAVIFFDINNLKRMNDAFGHDDGDRLLVKVANQLMYWKAYGDVYRIGGDEFIVVMMNEEIENIHERVKYWYENLKPFNNYINDGFKCELAYGIAIYEGDDVNFEGLLDDADIEMYNMKSKLKSG